MFSRARRGVQLPANATNRAVESLRMFSCANPSCNATVCICNECDCGDVYGSAACSEAMSRAAHRARNTRYGRTFRGRRSNARRQQRQRERRRGSNFSAQIVTDACGGAREFLGIAWIAKLIHDIAAAAVGFVRRG